MDLASAMEAAGLDDPALAALIDVTPVYIKMLRDGDRQPSVHTAIQITKALADATNANPAPLALMLFPDQLAEPMAFVQSMYVTEQNGSNGHAKVTKLKEAKAGA